MATSLIDDAGDLLKKYGGQAVDTMLKPVTDKLNQQMDKLAAQARVRAADRAGVDQSQITDLQVAEYLAGIPTANMTEEIGQQMQYIGKTTRNGIIIGLGMVAVAILIIGLMNKKKTA